MKQSQSDEDLGATGWISMCDVYLLFSALVLAMCIAVAGVAVQLGVERDHGLYRIAALEEAGGIRLPAELELDEDGLVATIETLLTERRARLELADQMTDLESVLERERLANAALSATHRDLMATHADAERLIESLRAQLESMLAQRDRIAVDLDASATEVGRLTAELAARQVLPDAERRVRSELLGLRGSLDRAVFLVDRSGSMNEGGRWEDAIATIRTWLEHLPVQEAALITFSDRVDAFPANGQMLRMDDDGRRLLIERLSGTRPAGLTNTFDALEAAYRYAPVDAFVLFTDGAPNPGGSAGPGRGDARAVLELITQKRSRHPELRIHTVGIGEYFNAPMRDFLLGAASITDGTFIGR